MGDIATWRVTAGVAVLTLNNPPVNAISQAVRQALVDGVRRAEADNAVTALVVACAGRTFFAGADIREFGKPATEPYLPDVVDAVEQCEKPVVAAIHGSALGGGLEIAMGCHYRVAVPSAKLGLPEVKLGMMPGARGTVLLPRLVGVVKALEICALGNPLLAPAAYEMGLVDLIAEDDLMEAACACARAVAAQPPRRTSELAVAPVDATVYEEFAKANARKFRGLVAPPEIIQSVRIAAERSFSDAARLEREAFLRLRSGPQAAALRHVFFAEREAAKVPVTEGVNPRAISSAGVVGSGTMGSGIALALLGGGVPVVLYERDPAALERGRAHIAKTLEGNIRAGRMTREKVDAALASLTVATEVSALGKADLIVEAAYETMEVKQEIFSALDDVAKPGAVLASNTSYLDLDAIAAVTARPANVIGLHFFAPANVMKLLEIVQGAETASDVIATAFDLACRLGKVGVLSGNAWGFIGNRMLAIRRTQAEAMAVEGAAPATVDAVLERFGMAMGPFRVGDLSGLDLGWSAGTSTGSTIRERLCEAGRRGRKAGAGFYDYDEGGTAIASSAAIDIIAGFARDQGIVQRPFTEEEILDRLLWPMVDEGAKILAEGIAQRESDIDVVWLNGYGWPAWTGGPMFHARQTGLAYVIERLEVLGLGASDALKSLARGETS